MLTMEQGRSGTLVFMSPQQLDGERGSHLDDIYSFGATVYELITSKPPFSSGNVDRQIREKIPPSMAVRRKELEIEGEPIDETWERVVAACLAKEPARRPQSFAEIAQKLEIASPKTVRARQAPAAKSAGDGLLASVVALKSNRNAVIGAAAAVLFIGAVAVWSFGFRKPAKPAPTQPVAAANTEESGANALGGVMVNTTPPRATVTLGGMDAGKSPITFKGIRAGKYPLRISLDGYTPVEREVEVKAGQFADLGTITLERVKGMAGGTRQVIEPQKVTTERKNEPRPEQPPANASQEIVVPLNDFSGG
jgi:hypothetical protein